MDHLGVEVETTAEVDAATARLAEPGCSRRSRTTPPAATPRQDKVWVHGPGHEPWEVYTVKEDSTEYGTDGVVGEPMGSCATTEDRAACCSGATAGQVTERARRSR